MFTTPTTPGGRIATASQEWVGAMADAVADDGVAAMNDAELVEILEVGGALLRRVEGLLVEATAEVRRRDADANDRMARLSTRYGSRNAVELLQRLAGVSARTAASWQRAARAAERPTRMLEGVGPAKLPEVRRAMLDGTLGVDGVLAIADPLLATVRRAAPDDLRAAQEAIATYAGEDCRPLGPDARFDTGSAGLRAPAVTADDLAAMARVWACAIDQDGAEPTEAVRERGRHLNLVPLATGLYRISGHLMPEVATQLERLFDAHLNPRLEPAAVAFREDDGMMPCECGAADANATLEAEIGQIPAGDSHVCMCGILERTVVRSGPQRRHDALAAVLSVAARAHENPVVTGMAPTLLVTVRDEDLRSGSGWAHLDGCDTPVSIDTARTLTCGGTVQYVALNSDGAITALSSESRTFTVRQRRAIIARDGECVVPGCHVPSTRCEIHHVIEHAQGGPTHTDNGVTLCWHHHRTLHQDGWRFRITRGVVQLRPPARFDHRQRWLTPPPMSPTRAQNLLRAIRT